MQNLPQHRSSKHSKRDSDLLAEVPDHVIHLDAATGSDSLLSQLFLGPLTMISFLLSLYVVDGQQRAWRVSQHQHHGRPQWKWTWWNAEPYQSHDSTWQHAVPAITTLLDGASANVPAPAVHTETWHTRKKHRKMAKLSISDAFNMRESMASTLIAVGLLALIAVAWLATHLLSALA